MKWLSDIDRMSNGTFGIEWEYEDGHRWWETFPTEKDREIELDKYEKERITYAKEYKEAEERMERNRMEWYRDDLWDMLTDDEKAEVTEWFIKNG